MTDHEQEVAIWEQRCPALLDRLRSAEEALRMFDGLFGGSNPGCDSPIPAEDAGGWEGEMAQCGTCFGCCLGQSVQKSRAHFARFEGDAT